MCSLNPSSSSAPLSSSSAAAFVAASGDETVLSVGGLRLGLAPAPADEDSQGNASDLLARRLGDAADWSDAARAARAVFRSAPPERLLQDSRVGCMVERLGWTDETLYSARLSSHALVPRLQDGRLVAVA